MLNNNLVKNLIVPGCRLSKDEGGTVVDTTSVKQMIDNLIYLTAIWPDLIYYICLISRYMERPIELHLQAAKRILRYLKGMAELGIAYKKEDKGIGRVCWQWLCRRHW